MLNKNTSQGGFIALVSAIIIAVVLITLVVAVSFAGFFGRFDIFDSEIKEVSQGLAEACIETAILKHAQDNSYAGGDTILVGDETCDILSVSGSPLVEIYVSGVYKNAYTNLEVIVDSASDYSVTSWRECPKISGDTCIF